MVLVGNQLFELPLLGSQAERVFGGESEVVLGREDPESIAGFGCGEVLGVERLEGKLSRSRLLAAAGREELRVHLKLYYKNNGRNIGNSKV